MPSTRPLNVVHFNTYGPIGGAARAAYNIHRSVLEAGCESWLVVTGRAGNDERMMECGTTLQARRTNFINRHRQTAMIRQLRPDEVFYPDILTRASINDLELPVRPDIIHLHWIAGFLSAEDIGRLWQRYRVPFVWTLMDLAPLTGGCHYTRGCEGFTARCGHCPIIHSPSEGDLSRRTWLAKSEWLRDVPITIVGATEWTMERVRRGSLFQDTPQQKIPFGIDTAVFRPRPKASVRRLLNLPLEPRIVLIGSTNHRDERKGLRYAIEALQTLPATETETAVLIAGHADRDYSTLLPQRCFPIGHLNNDRLLSMAYQAADVFLCPSLEDVGPLMIPEALLCGTPVVAFAEGCGAPDFIQPGVNGYLARMRDLADLAQGIRVVFEGLASGDITEESCRDHVLRDWNLEVQGLRYRELYETLHRDSDVA